MHKQPFKLSTGRQPDSSCASDERLVLDDWGRVGIPFNVGPNKLIGFWIGMGNSRFPAFLDTGASGAFMDSRAYTTLCHENPSFKRSGLRPSPITSIQCSNSAQQGVLGEFQTTISMGAISLCGIITVVKNQPVALLLGGSLFIEAGLCIDYRRWLIFGPPTPGVAHCASAIPSESVKTSEKLKTVRFADEKASTSQPQPPPLVPSRTAVSAKQSETPSVTATSVASVPTELLASDKSESRSDMSEDVAPRPTLYAPHDYHVNAESKHVIWCEVPLAQRSFKGELLVEADEATLCELGLVATALVAQIVNGCVPVQLLNLNAVPTFLARGRRLATITAVIEPKKTASFVVETGVVQAPLKRADKLAKVLDELKFSTALTAHASEKQDLLQLLDKHLDVFAANDEDIGRVQLIEHAIETGDALPARSRARFYSPTQRVAIKTEVDKYKQAGIVRPSSSPWAAPVLIVKKKDGTNRMCIDYRQLNMVTVPDSFPLPNMRTLFDKLHGSKWFTAFDVLWGYHNIKIAPDSIAKTAFIANDELLEFTRMPFGLSNAPATFQRMIMTALVGLGEISAAYLDDILVYAPDLPKLLIRMDIVLDRITEAGLKLKPRKCVLPVQEIPYLGYNVSFKGITPIQAKLDVIRDWPQPKTTKELRGFLGFVNRYFTFYPDVAGVTAPLARATNQRPLKWTAELQTAFEKSKIMFQKINTLAIPDAEGEFILETDASNVGIGACLLQPDENGHERPVGYYSKALNSAQRNYAIYKLEFFALYQAVKHFAVYLAFLSHFKVRVDNQALRFWRTSEFPPGDVRAKWKAFLDPFRFDIEHLAGDLNTIADAISRAPHTVETTPNRPIHARKCAPAATAASNPAMALTTDEATPVEQPPTQQLNVKSSYGREHQIIIAILTGAGKVKDETIKAGPVELKELYGRRHELCLQEGLIMRRAGTKLLLYVPLKRRDEVLEAAHQIAHQSAEKMLETLKQRYWWPSIRRDITRYVSTCETCVRTRAVSHTPHAQLQLFPAASRFELVHIDILGGRTSLPETAGGHKYILNIIDHFTRYCVAVPLKDQKAETVADAFVTHWVWRFAAPMRLHSDQGTNFESTLFAEMCQRLHIAKSRTLAYNPRSNGSVERVNRTILAILRALVADQPKRWDQLLPQALFAYNTTPHRSTGVSPFLLVHGDEARLPVELILGSPPESKPVYAFVHQLIKHMAIASETARMASNRAQRLAKDYYDSNINTRLYKTGDIVFVQIGQLKPGTSHKLAARWLGPCVVQSVRGVQVEVLDPKGALKRIHHNRLSAPTPFLQPKPAVLKRGRVGGSDSESDDSEEAEKDDDSHEEEDQEIETERPRTPGREPIGVPEAEDLPDSDDELEDVPSAGSVPAVRVDEPVAKEQEENESRPEETEREAESDGEATPIDERAAADVPPVPSAAPSVTRRRGRPRKGSFVHLLL